MTASELSDPATTQGAKTRKTIRAARRGVPKFLRQMPQTIAAADKQAIVANTQSLLARHR
jgi:hypothetical protein